MDNEIKSILLNNFPEVMALNTEGWWKIYSGPPVTMAQFDKTNADLKVLGFEIVDFKIDFYVDHELGFLYLKIGSGE